MSEHLVRFDRNIRRVDNLCTLFERAKESPRRPSITEADILRAAVVFLHSSFEDYFRGVLSQWLPIKGDEKALDKISLLNSENRAEKFPLGTLKAFEDMTVAELISKSIQQHMQRVSFNNMTDICTWGKKIGLDFDEFSEKELVNNMIGRRHKIVHEADANQSSGKGNHQAASINITTVRAWESATINLVSVIDAQITEWENT